MSGSTTADADSVLVSFAGNALEGQAPNQEQEIPIDPKTGAFDEEIPFPAGGWFSMKLKLEKAGRVFDELRVDKFGVGEVFVGAGQSNSTNSGQFQTKQTSGMVSSFDGEHWQIADDPQIGVADHSQGGSYYPAFGDALFEHYQVPIGIASTGFGGTSVNASATLRGSVRPHDDSTTTTRPAWLSGDPLAPRRNRCWHAAPRVLRETPASDHHLA